MDCYSLKSKNLLNQPWPGSEKGFLIHTAMGTQPVEGMEGEMDEKGDTFLPRMDRNPKRYPSQFIFKFKYI